MIDRARHHVARSKLGARIEIRHEPVAVGGQFELRALTAHRLGDQEVLDLQIVEAGRVELVELHVRDPRARAPCHRDPVPRCAARRGRELVDADRAPGGEDGRARGEQRHLARRHVKRIDAPHMPVGGEALAMAAGDEIDRRHVAREMAVGVGLGRLQQRLLHRPAGRVVDMHDAAMAVPALAREMPAVAAVLARIERHAERRQPIDRGRRVLDHELHGAAIVEAGARHHRVLDMALERVAGFQHSGDAALRPGGRSLALGQHDHAEAIGEVERRGQPGGTRPDDDDVVAMVCQMIAVLSMPVTPAFAGVTDRLTRARWSG